MLGAISRLFQQPASVLSLKFVKEVDLVHPVRGDMFIDWAETRPPAPCDEPQYRSVNTAFLIWIHESPLCRT